MATPTETPKAKRKVTLYGVDLINRKFVPVKITVNAEDCEPCGPPCNYLENAYTLVMSAIDDEGLKRAPDRYRGDHD